MKLPILRKFRKLLREHMGIDLSYSKYSPRIYEKKIYDHYCPGLQIKTIFDVGANIGQSATAFRKQFPDADIFSFEPFERNFILLDSLTGTDSRLHSYKMALSDKSGSQIVLTDSVPNSQWNSLSAHKQSKLQANPEGRSEEITTIRGADFCRQQGIQTIDLLKIDTEGFEYQVLEGFNEMLSSRAIHTIVLEVGFFDDEGHGNLEEISNFLKPYCLRLAGLYEVSYRADGRCDYANALFVVQSK